MRYTFALPVHVSLPDDRESGGAIDPRRRGQLAEGRDLELLHPSGARVGDQVGDESSPEPSPSPSQLGIEHEPVEAADARALEHERQGADESTIASHEPDGAEGRVSRPAALHSAVDGGADRLYPGVVRAVLAPVD